MPLKREQYNALMRAYDLRQADNMHDLERRKEEVLRKIPELQSLNNRISENAASRARAGILGRQQESLLLEKEASELRRKKAELFQNAGIPDDYLELRYTCPDCRDTGFIGNEKCHCFRQAAIDLLYDQSNMKEVLKRENFGTLSYEYYEKEAKNGSVSQYEYMQDRIARLRRYTEEFDEKGGSILFYGSAGTGKTFLTHCIAKELIDTCHSVVYFTADALFEMFRKNSRDFDEEDAEEMDRYILDSDLLIIDDLGTENITGFSTGKLFSCINDRLLNNKSMIISTNLRPQSLADLYTDRVASRILNSFLLIQTGGADIRQLKNRKIMN